MGRFSFWLGFTGLVIGSVFGAMDMEFMGVLVGGFVGGFAGALVGEILDILVAPLLGDRMDNSVARWFFRILGLAFLVVFCHELFWAFNFVSLTATHNIGARITRHMGRNESPESIQEMLAEHRWQVSSFAIRPSRWLLLGDVSKTARSTQDMIDDVTDNRLPVNANLTVRGQAIARQTEGLLDEYIPRTLLLRFLPRDILIPKE